MVEGEKHDAEAKYMGVVKMEGVRWEDTYWRKVGVCSSVSGDWLASLHFCIT